MNKKKSSFLTIFAILTTVTILTWISVTSYLKLKKIDLSSVPVEVLSPMNPDLDTTAFDSLEKKRVMTEEEISQFSLSRVKKQANPIEATESATTSSARAR